MLDRLGKQVRHFGDRVLYGQPVVAARELPWPGATLLTDAERASGNVPVGSSEALDLATEIASRGVDWRDNESQRLADRAATVLTTASVVLGIGGGLVARGSTSLWVDVPLVSALIVYVLLAILMFIALRPRPLPRQTGYAVRYTWSDVASLHRRYHQALLERAEELDRTVRAKARLVVVGAGLLAMEVVLLTFAIVVGVLQTT
jgi:hypothetical protein